MVINWAVGASDWIIAMGKIKLELEEEKKGKLTSYGRAILRVKVGIDLVEEIERRRIALLDSKD